MLYKYKWILTDTFVYNILMLVSNGEFLSPNLFNFYINDLVNEIKRSNLGIDNEYFDISILMYADDIALVSDSVRNMQGMLDKWRLSINVNKTGIVHFRTKSKERTTFNFQLGDNTLGVLSRYKYLGLLLDEYLIFDVTTEVLANSAGRALGSVINKSKQIGCFKYNSYIKHLFRSIGIHYS